MSNPPVIRLPRVASLLNCPDSPVAGAKQRHVRHIAAGVLIGASLLFGATAWVGGPSGPGQIGSTASAAIDRGDGGGSVHFKAAGMPGWITDILGSSTSSAAEAAPRSEGLWI